MRLKQRTWELLEVAKPGDRASKVVDWFILALIFLNIVDVILGSVKSLEAEYGAALFGFEAFSVGVFTVEYLLRVWSCVSCPEYAHPVFGRLRYMLKPMSLIDLFAVLPFYVEAFTVDLRFIRILRLFRIFRIAKLGRYSSSVRLFGRVINRRKEELIVTVMIMVLLIVLASSSMYFAETDAQPDKFPDIPTTMWWAVVTLTTVGYGDVYPVTGLGKFFATIIAILGVGMFALPTGILGASFVEEIEKAKVKKTVCPHCGMELE